MLEALSRIARMMEQKTYLLTFQTRPLSTDCRQILVKISID